MNKIYTCLWFDDNVEEVAQFYTGIFKDSKILTTSKYLSDAPGKKEGDTLVCEVELNGLKFQLLNGGPVFKFNESISFVVDCDDQEEVDYYWNALIDTNKYEGQCGWLKDKYGVSWQIVPKLLNELINGPDKEKAKKAFDAMMQMKKIIVADLEKAVNS